ncbi:hypothetical protein [Arthrobacter sp. H5]|uniref:hypothetical protein n=1 Tax=Arthrobacter sp. H5 TaxID=1267973 RepID=UPI00048375D8|nr:hypothetical protein [Arthrobacter sp. H5]
MSLRTDSTTPPTAPRLRRPSWRDPRLLIGLLLVLASVAGIIALVESIDRTTDVYAAREDLPVGSEITAEDFMIVPVRLGDLQDTYQPAREGIPENAVVLRLINGGELVPSNAIGGADLLGRKPVGLNVTDPLPQETSAGDRVDVWISPKGEGTSFLEPQLLLEAAEISEYSPDEGTLGGSLSTRVYVLVDDEKLPGLLEAISNEARIAVVLNAGGS